MTRIELIGAIAGLLFAAYAAGFFSHWLLARVTRPRRQAAPEAPSEEARAAARDAAERQASEAGLHARLARAEAEAKTAREALERARQEAGEPRRDAAEPRRTES